MISEDLSGERGAKETCPHVPRVTGSGEWGAGKQGRVKSWEYRVKSVAGSEEQETATPIVFTVVFYCGARSHPENSLERSHPLEFLHPDCMLNRSLSV